jgi:hypothetical protein
LKIYHALKETSDLSDTSTLTAFAGIATSIAIKLLPTVDAKPFAHHAENRKTPWMRQGSGDCRLQAIAFHRPGKIFAEARILLASTLSSIPYPLKQMTGSRVQFTQPCQ